MEFCMGRSSAHEGRLKQEKTSESSSAHDHHHHHPKQEDNIHVLQVASLMENTTGPSSPSTKKEEGEKLECAKAEMGEVREENQRLKQHLEQVLKDYRTLQMQFQDVLQKDTKLLHHQQTVTDEESDLVCLSLGRSSSELADLKNINIHEKSKALVTLKDDIEEEEYKQDLALGLDCKFETSKSESTNNELSVPNFSSPTVNSSDEAPRNSNKAVKTVRDNGGEDQVSQQNNPAKKARVCVRARCDTPTMNDGCQWRKYGQKIAKGNPCPRAYYRCTVAPSCPVRKQVQRCAEDMSILITTYEGIHNHPLPLSATAMASTTSAAASMLLTGSSTSSLPSSAVTATASADIHGLNLYLSDSFKSKQIYLSNPTLSSSSSSSSSNSHPTITLDLTTTNPSSRIFTSNYNVNPPRSSLLYPSSTSLDFSPSIPIHGFLSNSTSNSNSNMSVFSSINLARPTMENVYHHLPNYMQKIKNSTSTLPPASHALPADPIAAATKAITADPKFQSALAVALTSIINGAGSGGGAENLGHKIKWGDLFPASSSL